MITIISTFYSALLNHTGSHAVSTVPFENEAEAHAQTFQKYQSMH